jgi:hypothetical protein
MPVLELEPVSRHMTDDKQLLAELCRIRLALARIAFSRPDAICASKCRNEVAFNLSHPTLPTCPRQKTLKNRNFCVYLLHLTFFRAYAVWQQMVQV